MNDKILKNGFILNINTETIALVAIALAVLVRIIYLGSREFWYDEVLSLLLSTGQRSSYTNPGDLPVVLADYTSLLSIPKESGLAEVLKTCVQLLKSLLGENLIHQYFSRVSTCGCDCWAIAKRLCVVSMH